MSNIVFIIDKSASVQPYIEPYVNAINGFIKNVDPNSHLTTITFNNSINFLCLNLPLSQLDRPLNSEDINPSGPTAFYDCIVSAINRLHTFYVKTTQNPPIVIILTDGEDTCSKLITKTQVALQIAIAKKYGWQFIFLGVTENSMNIGREIGCNVCIIYNTTEKSFSEIPNVLSMLIKARNIPNLDLDIRDLSDSFSDIKIN
jgi:uncharacterized protein YegL